MTAPLWTDELLAALAANGRLSAAAIERDGSPIYLPAQNRLDLAAID